VIDSAQATRDLRSRGWSLLDGASMRLCLGESTAQTAKLVSTWNQLPPDLYLKDGGRYRFRRHASAIVKPSSGVIERVPHRPHWQPTTYNALHGGIRRWFEPIEDAAWNHGAMQSLIRVLGRVFIEAETGAGSRWFVEAHQFRIDASREIGKPTPEGAHRDGVDFVAVVLIGRTGIAGGETAVRDADGALLAQTTLTEPWTALLMDDRRVKHETTPVVGTGAVAHRDTLVLTYRAGGFMEPDA
jgi:hypothetical protein